MAAQRSPALGLLMRIFAQLTSATIRHLAGSAGVSIAAVSRVFDNLDDVAEPTGTSLLPAAEALGCVPHSGAGSLSTRSTDTIGAIFTAVSSGR